MGCNDNRLNLHVIETCLEISLKSGMSSHGEAYLIPHLMVHGVDGWVILLLLLL